MNIVVVMSKNVWSEGQFLQGRYGSALLLDKENNSETMNP